MREWFGIVRWHCDDVIEAARSNGIEMTEEQARQWWEDNEEALGCFFVEHPSMSFEEVLDCMEV